MSYTQQQMQQTKNLGLENPLGSAMQGTGHSGFGIGVTGLAVIGAYYMLNDKLGASALTHGGAVVAGMFLGGYLQNM